VAIPLAVHSAISIACSALIFPESLNAQFTKRLIAVFTPLSKALRTQPGLLRFSPHDKKFDPTEFQTLYVCIQTIVLRHYILMGLAYFGRVSQAEAALMPLRASSELLRRDFSFGKRSGADLKALRDFARRLTVRCDGLAFFYRIIDPLRDGFPQTHLCTPPTSHMPSPHPVTPSNLSRRGSMAPQSSAAPTGVELEPANCHTTITSRSNVKAQQGAEVAAAVNCEISSDDSGGLPSPVSASQSQLRGAHGSSPHWYGHSFHLHQKLAHLRHHRLHIRTPSLLHEALHHSAEQEVGLFESQVCNALPVPFMILLAHTDPFFP
jgi:hypothetical protein